MKMYASLIPPMHVTCPTQPILRYLMNLKINKPLITQSSPVFRRYFHDAANWDLKIPNRHRSKFIFARRAKVSKIKRSTSKRFISFAWWRVLRKVL